MIQTLRVLTYHTPSLTISFAFLTLSVLNGTWIARIPGIQAHLGLNNAQLGLALLGLSLGSLTMSLLSGWILSKFTTGQAALYSTLVFCVTFILPTLAFNQWSLMLALALLGAANSFMNIAINAAAASIERHYRITIMSACHGMFSLGGMIGAALSGWIATLEIPPTLHFAAIAAIMIVAHWNLRPIVQHLPNSATVSGPRFALPRKSLLLLAFISFAIILSEGAIGDWSALYLRKELGGSPFIGSLGYAGFCLTMAIGRFSGDAVRQRWGTRNTIRVGAVIGALGLILLVFTQFPIAGVLCFILCGIGFSTIVPTVYSAAARNQDVTPSIGLASVATAGVIGGMAGRLLIGNISELFSLPIALAGVAGLVLVAAAVATRVRE
ncbi:MAG: MFS transporter [Saprospiraceae bacterium]